MFTGSLWNISGIKWTLDKSNIYINTEATLQIFCITSGEEWERKDIGTCIGHYIVGLDLDVYFISFRHTLTFVF